MCFCKVYVADIGEALGVQQFLKSLRSDAGGGVLFEADRGDFRRRLRREAEALSEASDCLSTALAARIAEGEEIPMPSRPRRGQYLVSPDATIALKAALYSILRTRNTTVADLARRLDIDDRQAARLVDPRAASRLASLEAALSALGYKVAIELHEKPAA